MGLFDKKFCDVCGQKIGLLGNRKLEDGNLCKDCAAKLSPFFSDRRHTTVADIKEQLSYREANKEAVASFHTTKTLGTGTVIMLDETAKKFLVTRDTNLSRCNPDVMDFTSIIDCILDIDETKTEVMKEGPDGKKVSYSPKRYETEYDYYINIRVNNPYFDDIRFRLNSSSVAGTSIGETLKYKSMGQDIVKTLTRARDTDKREQEAAERKAASAPKPVVCPYCGATTVPDASGCCEYCGSPVNS